LNVHPRGAWQGRNRTGDRHRARPLGQARWCDWRWSRRPRNTIAAGAPAV